jgi:hypothetical protein
MYPLITKKLVEYLEGIYRDRLPDTDLTLDEFNYLRGQVSVVRFLRGLLASQKESNSQMSRNLTNEMYLKLKGE